MTIPDTRSVDPGSNVTNFAKLREIFQKDPAAAHIRFFFELIDAEMEIGNVIVTQEPSSIPTLLPAWNTYLHV